MAIKKMVVGVPTPGRTSAGSQRLSSANVRGGTHVATPSSSRVCFIKMYTPLIAEPVHVNQAASHNAMFLSPTWAQRLDFMTLGIINHISFFKDIHVIP